MIRVSERDIRCRKTISQIRQGLEHYNSILGPNDT